MHHARLDGYPPPVGIRCGFPPKASETLSPLWTGSSNPPHAVPLVKVEQAAHGPFLPAHKSQRTAGFALPPNAHTIPGVTTGPTSTHRCLFGCPFMARVIYLDVYSTVDITEEELMALTSLLYYVPIYTDSVWSHDLSLLHPERRI